MADFTEDQIQTLLISHCSKLGYPNAVPIRNVVIRPTTGRVDLMLLPAAGLHRVVLIEAKRSTASDAADKVVGQLLNYYSQVLTLGAEAVAAFRDYGKANPKAAASNEKTTPHKVYGGLKTAEVEKLLGCGKPLLPKEVALYVALDEEPSPRLKQIITVLSLHHDLNIGAIRVGPKEARVLAGADLTNRWAEAESA